MNRIDRISAILIQLQSKKVVKGQDIADRFSISLRTAYRDIKTLEEAGVPIISEAGVGYSLMEGYRLPPVMFTKEEALAFLTAEKLVAKLTDSSTYKIYESALFKIKSVLRNDEKDHLETMYDHIEVLGNPYIRGGDKTNDHIQSILKGISQKNILRINYFANHNQQNTIRELEPVGIFLMSNYWYLIAFCLLRKDYRTFRVERISFVKFTEKYYSTTHPPLKKYVNEILKEKHELQEVVMRVEKSIMKHFGEQKFYNGFVSEKEVDDKIEMTFLTASIEGFARWYMMFGDHAEIISPQNLKARIKEIASAIQKKLK